MPKRQQTLNIWLLIVCQALISLTLAHVFVQKAIQRSEYYSGHCLVVDPDCRQFQDSVKFKQSDHAVNLNVVLHLSGATERALQLQIQGHKTIDFPLESPIIPLGSYPDIFHPPKPLC